MRRPWSRPAFDCISSRVRSCLVPRSPKSIGTETGKTLLLLTSAVVALLLKGRCVQNPEKTLRGFGPNSMAVRRSANIRRRSEAKHCSSLCSQSEGGEYCGGQTRLKIQQSHAPKRWPYSLRVRAPHFASKVSYNAGASTDDYVGQRKSTLRGRCCQYLIFYFEHPTFQGRCRLSANLIFLDFERPTRLGKKKPKAQKRFGLSFFLGL